MAAVRASVQSCGLPVEQSSAFNAAVSFVTNTNWQGYSGGSTMSYLTQMAELTTQNFASAAAGIAIAIALCVASPAAAQTIGLAIAAARRRLCSYGRPVSL
jgi:K+-transporting ATPase A subunit